MTATSTLSSFDTQLHSDEMSAAEYGDFIDSFDESSIEVEDEDIDIYAGESDFVDIDPDFFMDSHFESCGEF